MRRCNIPSIVNANLTNPNPGQKMHVRQIFPNRRKPTHSPCRTMQALKLKYNAVKPNPGIKRESFLKTTLEMYKEESERTCEKWGI